MSSELRGTQSHYVSMLGNEAFNLKEAELGAPGRQELQNTPPERISKASSWDGLSIEISACPFTRWQGESRDAAEGWGHSSLKGKRFHKHDLPLSPFAPSFDTC